MLTAEKDADDKREDRASLGTLNALDGVYMSFPATLRVPGHSWPGCLQVS